MSESPETDKVTSAERLKALDAAGERVADSVLSRVLARYRRWRMDRAAKSKAYITHCGRKKTRLESVLSASLGIIFELMTIALGLVFIWFNALFFFLKAETVDLNVFKPNAALWFSETFDGRSADIGGLRVDWVKEHQALGISADDVTIYDAAGVDFLRIPKVDAQFDLAALVFGRFAMTHAVIEGGSVTAIRHPDSRIAIGLGHPQSFEDFTSLMAPGIKPDGEIDATAQQEDQDPALKSLRRPVGNWRNLQSLDIVGGEAFIIDEKDGGHWRLQNLNLTYAIEDDQLTVTSDSNIVTASAATPLKLNFQSNYHLTSFNVDLDMQDFRPANIAPERGLLSHLRALDAPVSLTSSIKADAQKGLTETDINIIAGSGQLRLGDRPAKFNAANLTANYNVDTQALDISKIDIKSDQLRIDGTGKVTQIGSPQAGYGEKPVRFDLDLTPVFLDLGEGFEAPLDLEALQFKGAYDLNSRDLSFDNLALNFGDYSVTTAGAIGFRDGDQPLRSLRLTGQAAGFVTPQTVLKHWPLEVALGGRDWIKDRVEQGDLSEMNFDINMTPEALQRGVLFDEDLTVTFNYQNARVRYLSTMSPLENAAGYATLQGNRFDLTVNEATIGAGLTVISGQVELPRLNPKGGLFNIALSGYGSVSDLLTVANEPPLLVADKAKIKPPDFSGMGTINLALSRPLLRNVNPGDLTYTVTGKFDDVSAPFRLGSHHVENGQIDLFVDTTKMTLSGPASLGPLRAQFDMLDEFDGGLTPTAYTVNGTISRDDFDRVGIGMREYFDGEIALNVKAYGDGLSLNSADINADLSAANLRFGQIASKPLGQAGVVNGRVLLQPDGSISLQNIDLTARGIALAGRVDLASDFRLLSADLQRAQIDGFIDASVKAASADIGDLKLTLDGPLLDLSRWGDAVFTPAPQQGEAQASLPLRVSANIDRLLLTDDFILTDAAADYHADELGVISLSLSGQDDGEGFKANITPLPDEAGRALKLEIPQAGKALKRFYGLENIEGGKMEVSGVMAERGAPGGLTGTAQIEGFKLVNAPVFARMLSLASLQGLGEILSGDGMNFQSLTLPFTYEDGKITVTEATASGSALGLTGSGYVDFNSKDVDITGVLVPAYTINSMLGGIPLLGDIVVGKKGEGIFALNYFVQGPFEKTQVGVNPLSALTPGFLRQIFQPRVDTRAKPDDADGVGGEALE